MYPLGIGLHRRGNADELDAILARRVRTDGGVVESTNCIRSINPLLKRASLLLIPSGYKGGKLYAEIPTNGNGDLTWTRGGDAFRTNASGVIQRVPWNLLTNSNDLSQASWSKSNITVTLNSIANPLNGLVNAQTFTPNTTNGLHYAFSNQTTPAGQTYLMSFYVKANGYTNCRVENAANSTGVWFNLSNGTITSGTGGTITALSNGWYFVSVLLTSSGSSTGPLVSFAPSTSLTFAGDGTSGGYVFGAQLVEGTTAQTYLPTTDRLNFPRLSYMYGSCPSALLEPQRTNLLTRTQEFDNAIWGKSFSAITANTTTSPDGTINADTFYANVAITSNPAEIMHYTSQAVNTTYAFSVYAKKSTSNFIALRFTAASGNPYAWFNLNTGAVGTVQSGITASIQSVGDGWYRCVVIGTTASTIAVNRVDIVVSDNNGSFVCANNGSIFIYGAQLEAGAYPTTYIPTTTASATRIADSFSRSNIYTNGLISASGGTWFVELRNNISYTRDASGQFGIDTASGGQTNGFSIRNGVPGQLNISKYTSGSVLALWATADTTVKIAIKWNGSTADIFVNGTKVVSATSFTTTAMEFLLGNGNDVPKFIQQMALFPIPLSDTDCQTLTT